MIDELKYAIDEADKIGSNKAKEILLKVAMLKEENQENALNLIKLMISEK